MDLKNRRLVQDYRFARVAHSRPATRLPTIGFEYEIPLNIGWCMERDIFDDEYEADMPGDWYSRPEDYVDGRVGSPEWWDERGFISHYEEGGLEVGSPVHFNISQARDTAKALIKTIDEIPFLQHEQTDVARQHTGIHVHAGIPSEHQRHASFIGGWASLVLNRRSSADFLRLMGSRPEGHSYFYNQQACGWDDSYETGIFPMTTRNNGFGDTKTVEYRIFNGVSDRLLPAIDFAHAFTRWITPHALRNLSHQYATVSNDYRRHTISARPLREVVPYLTEFKEWLDKQPGYAALKSDPAMAAI